ncbi:MAG: hypothetical protein A3F74_23745 [Betaproteobacteria bacterium RIFCSPLOWO2_12_FULL_62_58]|nr:MAG: hypothetical protein A3F74_23745 [Betaproteobacteria bacterium RIFCSPLOWO2_12_FULL_62_58]
MNRKQFLILVVALLVLGGAGFALFWQDIAAYRASGAKIGAKLLPEFRIADVTQMRLRDAKTQATLSRKDTGWVVEERGGYAADVQAIGDFMVKLIELKVTQAENVGASLLPRVELAAPGAGEGVGTLVEFKDKAGKVLASLILGKKILKKDPMNPLPAAQDGVPAGRYILVTGAKDTVVVVSDPLHAADAAPGKWLAKDFFKADRIKTLAVGPEGAPPQWKITRDLEWGQWKFAGGGGDLDASAAVGAVNALGGMAFTDVAAGAKPEDPEKPLVAVAETFDNLTYTVKIAKKKTGNEYDVSFTISGDPAGRRTPEKDEKPEDTARRDKEFAENLKNLEARMAREKALAKWTYVVAKSAVEPLLKDRAQLIAQKAASGKRQAVSGKR